LANPHARSSDKSPMMDAPIVFQNDVADA
jgi:hypothetical protein